MCVCVGVFFGGVFFCVFLFCCGVVVVPCVEYAGDLRCIALGVNYSRFGARWTCCFLFS